MFKISQPRQWKKKTGTRYNYIGQAWVCYWWKHKFQRTFKSQKYSFSEKWQWLCSKENKFIMWVINQDIWILRMAQNYTKWNWTYLLTKLRFWNGVHFIVTSCKSTFTCDSVIRFYACWEIHCLLLPLALFMVNVVSGYNLWIILGKCSFCPYKCACTINLWQLKLPKIICKTL